MEDAAAPMQQTVTDAAVFSVMVADFSMFPAVDYVPNMEPAPMVGVEDVGDATVVDAVECAQQCAELVDCNAASYYGDNPPETWPGTFWVFEFRGADSGCFETVFRALHPGKYVGINIPKKSRLEYSRIVLSVGTYL